LKKAGAFGKLMPMLIHPEALDRSTGWWVDYMPWDTEDYITHISLSVEPNFVTMWYNTETVSAADLATVTSYNDWFAPRWKGRIVIGDVSNGEDLADASNAWLYLGKDWIDRLLGETDPTVIALGGTREYSDGLARGDWDIGIFPGGSRKSLENAAKLGLPVAQFPRTMKEGAFGGTTRRLGYLDPPAHPNAAKLFLNWILTKEGQTAYQEFNTNPNSLALRSDVPRGSVGDAQWARANDPNLKFEDEGGEETERARDEVQAYFVAKFKELGITP
jgi:iron(III) transport system substrate-binding protein